MKYRMISGWVTVTGPPFSICFFEERDHGTIGTEDIPEPYGNKFGSDALEDFSVAIFIGIFHPVMSEELRDFSSLAFL